MVLERTAASFARKGHLSVKTGIQPNNLQFRVKLVGPEPRIRHIVFVGA
jgi:hypothetical protein